MARRPTTSTPLRAVWPKALAPRVTTCKHSTPLDPKAALVLQGRLRRLPGQRAVTVRHEGCLSSRQFCTPKEALSQEPHGRARAHPSRGGAAKPRNSSGPDESAELPRPAPLRGGRAEGEDEHLRDSSIVPEGLQCSLVSARR